MFYDWEDEREEKQRTTNRKAHGLCFGGYWRLKDQLGIDHHGENVTVWSRS